MEKNSVTKLKIPHHFKGAGMGVVGSVALPGDGFLVQESARELQYRCRQMPGMPG